MIDEIKSYLKRKVECYEIYSVSSEEISSDVYNNKVAFTSSGKNLSIGIRVLMNKKIGFSYTNNIKGYKRCVDTAIVFAKNNEPDKDFPGFSNTKIKGKMMAPSKGVRDINPEWLSKTIKGIVNDTKNINEKINVSEGELSRHIAKARIINSEGLDIEESYGKAVAAFGFSLKKGPVIENVGIMKASVNKLDADFGKEAANRLKSLLGRKSVKSGSYQLLLHPEALASLLSESYAFSINAENVHLNKSKFSSLLGKNVFSKKASLIDDGMTKNLLGSRTFDAEGSKTQKTKIIENGVLKHFIYDRKYALLDKKKSTGNASRAASSLPSISPNNAIMKPGNKSNIFSECDNAIYARGLLGVHTMNEATGDFSLGVQEGHLIRKGKTLFPLKGVIIAGNFFEMMNDIIEMSKKVEDIPHNGCSCVLPYVLFNKITVTSS